MALLTKTGYGQVEPNHLSAQRTAQIYAQLPCSEDVETLENGAFMKYDYAAGEVNATATAGEFMLVYNEVKLYEVNKQGYKDFALLAANMVDGVITPRLFKRNVGDIFTTNLADVTTAAGSRFGISLVPTYDRVSVAVLTETAEPAATDMVFMVVKETTMPDGQYALKVQRVQ